MRTTPAYQATAYYNLAFFRLDPRDAAALDLLRIRPEDRHLPGAHAFQPASPVQDARWLVAFFPEGGYLNVLRYFAQNPGRAWCVMAEELRSEARQIRAENFGNFERSDGFRYCTLAEKFSWASDAKGLLLDWAPLLCFLVCASAWLVKCHWEGARCLTAGLTVIGGVEFSLATLADALETHRHLLFFHAAYDGLLLQAICEMRMKRDLVGGSISWSQGSWLSGIRRRIWARQD